MTIEDEVLEKAKEIRTDNYAMSIGEICNLYMNNELDIHPEFQRFFRWTPLQKTKLIESILLGIPIPSIFVSQREDGVWDVVDGLQRLATIFEFMGILRDENGEIVPPKGLMRTKYLPSLEGKVWEDAENSINSISQPLKLDIKRSKLHFFIIEKQSDPDAKYELFQRLNTLGSKLSDQEVRNCLLVMINRDFFAWINNLSKDGHFQNCVNLSERLLEQQYDLELVLRFIAYKNSDISEITSKDVDEFLTEKMLEFAGDPSFDKTEEERIFKDTFSILDKALGEDAFKKYNKDKGRFGGKFLISAFEVIAIGLGGIIREADEYDISRFTEEVIQTKAQSIWDDELFVKYSGSGSNVGFRLPRLLPFGTKLFRDEN